MISFDVCECGAPLVRMERPTPVPTGSEVLLKVLAAGVCHSDIHIWDGYYDMGGGRKIQLTDRGIKLPLTMGHENVGEVVALGPDATGVHIGDRRLVFPWIGCGTCKVCREDEEQLCMAARSLGVYRNGGYADHLLVPHPRYLLDIGDMPPERAAPLACSGVTTYGALKKLGSMIVNEPVVIIGAGGLGLMALALLKAMGGIGAIVVDIDRVQTRGGNRRRCDCNRRRRSSRRTQADHQTHQRRRLVGDRSGRRIQHGQDRHGLSDQRRQADRGWIVRRQYHHLHADDPAQSDDDPRLVRGEPQ